MSRKLIYVLVSSEIFSYSQYVILTDIKYFSLLSSFIEKSEYRDELIIEDISSCTVLCHSCEFQHLVYSDETCYKVYCRILDDYGFERVKNFSFIKSIFFGKSV